MMATSPHDLHPLWQEAFAQGDFDALLELYESDAVLLPRPGESPVSGKPAIREAMGGLHALGADVTFTRLEVVGGDDVAIVYATWVMRGGADPDGNPIDMAATATDVVRRQPDGTW